jgi:hypothetical protein
VSTEHVIGYDVPEITTLQVPVEAALTTTVDGYLILKADVAGILFTFLYVIVYSLGWLIVRTD